MNGFGEENSTFNCISLLPIVNLTGGTIIRCDVKLDNVLLTSAIECNFFNL